MQIIKVGDKARKNTQTTDKYWQHKIRVRHTDNDLFPWMFTNCKDAKIGARIKVVKGKGITNILMKGAENSLVEPINNGFMLTILDDDITLWSSGNPQSKIQLKLTHPTYSQSEPLIGILMPHMAIPDNQTMTPWCRYFAAIDHVHAIGGNYVSFYPIKSWNSYDIGDPFDGKISQGLSEEFKKVKAAVEWYAMSKGIHIDWYLFTMIDLKHASLWAGNPLNVIHNDSEMYLPDGWIPNHVVTSPMGHTLDSPRDFVHYVVQAQWPELAHQWMRKYINDMTIWRKDNAEIVNFLESESKRVDIEIANISSYKHATNFEYLWIPEKFNELGPDEWKSGSWRDLLEPCAFIVQHQNTIHDLTNAQQGLMVAEHYDKQLMASDDGTKDSGGGEGRYPNGYRHNAQMSAQLYQELQNLWGARMRGFEIKVLTLEDLLDHGAETMTLIKGV